MNYLKRKTMKENLNIWLDREILSPICNKVCDPIGETIGALIYWLIQ